MRDFVPNAIYRHFKGGYYLVHESYVTTDDEKGVHRCVTYTSLGDGRRWARDFDEFMSEVPEDRENPMGQKYRFEIIRDFDNPLKTTSTEALLRELSSRSDAPATSLSEDAIFIDEYVVGRVRTVYIGDDDIAEHVFGNSSDYEEQLVIDTVHDQLSSAVRRVEQKPKHEILRRVTYRVSL